MIALAKRVSRRFVPTQEIFITCAIDLGTALACWIGLWFVAAYLPEWAVKIGNFAIHVLILMAVWNPLQHARRTYHQHVKRAFEIAVAALRHRPTLVGGPLTCPACQESKFTDELDMSPHEGTRTFACGLAMDTDGAVSGKCRGVDHPKTNPRERAMAAI